MARVSPKQNRFSRGQVSPKLHGSQDLELYYTALEVCRNYIVDGRGMLVRRPGTKFLARTKADGPAVLIPFAYDLDQAYQLEMGAGYMRALFNGGVVLNGASPFEIATPYTVEQMQEISYHQLKDLLWMAHRNIPFKALSRTAIDQFSIADFAFRDGPYLDTNATSTFLIPGATGSLTPAMTSNTAPSGVVANSVGGADAFRVFDQNAGTRMLLSGARNGFVQYNLPAGSAVVNAYYLVADWEPEQAPSSWTIEGYDGAGWVVLDSRNGVTDWGANEHRAFSFKNETAYSAYRLVWTANSGLSGDSSFAELGLNRSGDFSAPFAMAASSPAGINNGQGFSAADVGRPIRLLGDDGLWRYVVIASVVNATNITVRFYGPPLPSLARISQWRLGALFSGNYPAVVAMHENRLAIGAGNNVYLSATGDYSNMAPTQPDGTVLPDDAISVVVPAYNTRRGAVSRVTVLKSKDFQLFVGSVAGNFTIQSNSFGDGLTPDNVTLRPQEGRGAGRLDPEIVGGSILYAHNTKEKLMGTYDKDNSRVGAQDLSLPSDDIAERGIRWMAYQEHPHGVLWVGLNDGTMAAITIQPEEKVQAWHEHPVGGRFITNGATRPAQVESACVTPGNGGKRDDVFFIVKRTIGGTVKRFIEMLQPYRRIGDDLKESFFIDGALQYSGNQNAAATMTITGSGPTTVRSIDTTNCPPFVAGTVLSLHDGRRWHRGRILTVDGNNDLTWKPVAPNAAPGPADGKRWYFINDTWQQIAANAQIPIYTQTYVDFDQTAGISRWSIGQTAIGGLTDFEGEYVDLLVDGYFIPRRLVTGGTIADLPEGTIILVGFHEPTKGKLLSIEAGSQNGSAQGKQRPVYETVFDVLDSGSTGFESGTGLPSASEKTWEFYVPVRMGNVDDDIVLEGEPRSSFTGLGKNPRDEQGDIENPSVAWTMTEPLPSFVRGVITRLNESDGN